MRRGRFLSVSAAAQALWGYAPGELVGVHYLDLVASCKLGPVTGPVYSTP